MRSYIVSLQKLLSQNAHPENSIHMKRYMKDQFEFFGINSVERKELTRKFFTAQGIPSKHDYKEVIRELWDLPQREFQYAALDILEHLVKKRIQVKIELLDSFVD